MPIKPCEYCGKPVKYFVSQADRKRFCSVECRNKGVGAANVKTYHRTCKQCGKSFTVGSDKRRSVTCSPECAHSAQGVRDAAMSIKVACVCERCGKSFMAFPSRKGRYCSRPCSRADAGNRNTGMIRTSKSVPCGYCGKMVKQYKSRATRFCGADCYHAWDSLYKQTPEMKRRLALRMIAMGSKPSGIEQRVAEWLTTHGIQFEQQVKVHYSLIDFKVGDTLIEVNGCYWHACAEHFPMITPMQQKRITRDKTIATYCRKRGIPLLVIWEHDIKRGDFSALANLIRVV